MPASRFLHLHGHWPSALPPGRRCKNRCDHVKICHSEDGYAVRGNLPVGCRLYFSTHVVVKLYREIAASLRSSQ